MKRNKYSAFDFNPNSLPQKRSAVLRDVYKNRFDIIFKCGLVLLIFALPLFIGLFLLDLGKFGLDNASELVINSFSFYYAIFSRILITLFFFLILVAISGILRILKLLIWGEGIDFLYDFKLGIKENYKTIIIPSLILSILYLISSFCLIVFSNGVLSFGATILFVIIFVPLYVWIFLLSNVYKSSIKLYLQNGFFFFSKNLLWSFLGLILLIWPLLFEYYSFPFALLTLFLKYIFFILIFLFYYPFLTIIFMLFSMNRFDTFINNIQYPELFRKGLYNPQENKN